MPDSSGRATGVRPGVQKGHDMKKIRISSYWPLAIVVALVAIAGLRTHEGAEPRETLPVAQVTAEFARAVSYGLVDGATAPVEPASRGETPRAL